VNIRLSWKYTHANGGVLYGHSEWMRDSAEVRQSFTRRMQNASNDELGLPAEVWIEEDSFDRYPVQQRAASGRGKG